MITDPSFVLSSITNTNYCSKASHGVDCTIKSVNWLDSLSFGVVGLHKTQVVNYNSILSTDGFFKLKPGIYSITLNEGGEVPPGCMGEFRSRSSLVRNGAMVLSGIYDSGFKCDYFGVMMYVFNNISIEENARIATFILTKCESYISYDGQFQGEKDKK